VATFALLRAWMWGGGDPCGIRHAPHALGRWSGQGDHRHGLAKPPNGRAGPPTVLDLLDAEASWAHRRKPGVKQAVQAGEGRETIGGGMSDGDNGGEGPTRSAKGTPVGDLGRSRRAMPCSGPRRGGRAVWRFRRRSGTFSRKRLSFSRFFLVLEIRDVLLADIVDSCRLNAAHNLGRSRSRAGVAQPGT